MLSIGVQHFNYTIIIIEIVLRCNCLAYTKVHRSRKDQITYVIPMSTFLVQNDKN
jgi:hypothetical protein